MTPKRGPKKRPEKPVRGEIDPPKGMNAAEQTEFARLVEAMRNLGTLRRSDVRLIEATARTVVLLDRAHKELGKGKLTETAANGTPMPHPMLAVINSQTMRLRGLLRDLGLTPASSKLGTVGTTSGDDRWDGVLNVAG